jgi:hypothetical protein
MTLTKQKIQKPTYTKPTKQHHLKHYWPYLPLIAFIIIGYIAFRQIKPNQLVVSPSKISTSSLLNSLNKIRAQKKLPKLVLSNNLNQSALKVNDQLQNKQLKNLSIKNASSLNLSYGLNQVNTIINAWQKNTPTSQIFNQKTNQIGINIQNLNHQYLVSLISPGSKTQSIHIVFSVNNPIVKKPIQAKKISIIYELTNGLITNQLLLVIIGLIILIFIIRHFIFLKKTIIESEQLLISHLWLDFIIVLIILIGFILLQTAGYIF